MSLRIICVHRALLLAGDVVVGGCQHLDRDENISQFMNCANDRPPPCVATRCSAMRAFERHPKDETVGRGRRWRLCLRVEGMTRAGQLDVLRGGTHRHGDVVAEVMHAQEVPLRVRGATQRRHWRRASHR